MLQHLDDYLTLVGNMYYQAAELGKSTGSVRCGIAPFWRRSDFSPAECLRARSSLESPRYVSFIKTLQFAVIRRTTLGRLTTPIREPTVLGECAWQPARVASFLMRRPRCGRASFRMFSGDARTARQLPPSTSRTADRWSPYEIALFESGICMTGKLFPQLAQLIGSKSVKEVIEFYYCWKKSKNYAHWKAAYKSGSSELEVETPSS